MPYDPYRALAAAILLQATIDLRHSPSETYKAKLQRWFHSDWASALADLADVDIKAIRRKILTLRTYVRPVESQPPEWVSVSEAVRRTNITKHSLRWWIRCGYIATRRHGRRVFVNLTELANAAQKHAKAAPKRAAL